MGISPMKLMTEMARVDQLRTLLGDDADPKLLLDSIEGETDAMHCVDTILEMILRDELLAKQASARADRLEHRAAQWRATLLAILDEKLRLKRLERPLATTWITQSVPQPRVTEQDRLPAEYFKTTVDTNKLGVALRKGENIPGAELSNPRLVLNVRGG